VVTNLLVGVLPAWLHATRQLGFVRSTRGGGPRTMYGPRDVSVPEAGGAGASVSRSNLAPSRGLQRLTVTKHDMARRRRPAGPRDTAVTDYADRSMPDYRSVGHGKGLAGRLRLPSTCRQSAPGGERDRVQGRTQDFRLFGGPR